MVARHNEALPQNHHANADLPSLVAARPVKKRGAAQVGALVRWAFYVFVLSIPFEYPPRSIPVEVHTITGAIFLLAALSQPKVCFGKAPKALWWFAAYISIYLSFTVIFSQHIGEAIIFFFNLLQALFLFWACYNLMRHEAIAKRALLTFALSAAALAGMLVLGIGTTVYESTSEGSRVTVLGQDPNTVAANMALSIMALLGLAFGLRISAVRYRFILWPLVVLLCVSLVLTGSRGGVLALGVGLLATALRQGPLRAVARNFIVGSLLIACAGWVIVNTEPMKSRYEKSVKRGNMSGREHIFPNAWAMFQEKPVLGWGPVNEQYELAIRTRDFEFGDPTKNADRKTRASHNLVLEVLTATGLAGAIPLFTCIGLCVRAGWKARRSSQGVVPFTLVMVALMINMTVPLQAAKQFWLILAYALAYGSYSVSRKKRRLVAVPDARQRVPSPPLCRDASEALIGHSPGQ